MKSESLDDALLELGMEEGFDAGLEMSSDPVLVPLTVRTWNTITAIVKMLEKGAT